MFIIPCKIIIIKDRISEELYKEAYELYYLYRCFQNRNSISKIDKRLIDILLTKDKHKEKIEELRKKDINSYKIYTEIQDLEKERGLNKILKDVLVTNYFIDDDNYAKVVSKITVFYNISEIEELTYKEYINKWYKNNTVYTIVYADKLAKNETSWLKNVNVFNINRLKFTFLWTYINPYANFVFNLPYRIQNELFDTLVRFVSKSSKTNDIMVLLEDLNKLFYINKNKNYSLKKLYDVIKTYNIIFTYYFYIIVYKKIRYKSIPVFEELYYLDNEIFNRRIRGNYVKKLNTVKKEKNLSVVTNSFKKYDIYKELIDFLKRDIIVTDEKEDLLFESYLHQITSRFYTLFFLPPITYEFYGFDSFEDFMNEGTFKPGRHKYHTITKFFIQEFSGYFNMNLFYVMFPMFKLKKELDIKSTVFKPFVKSKKSIYELMYKLNEIMLTSKTKNIRHYKKYASLLKKNNEDYFCYIKNRINDIDTLNPKMLNNPYKNIFINDMDFITEFMKYVRDIHKTIQKSGKVLYDKIFRENLQVLFGGRKNDILIETEEPKDIIVYDDGIAKFLLVKNINDNKMFITYLSVF